MARIIVFIFFLFFFNNITRRHDEKSFLPNKWVAHPLPLTDRIFYSYMELAFSFPLIPHVELFQAHWSYGAITCAWHA